MGTRHSCGEVHQPGRTPRDGNVDTKASAANPMIKNPAKLSVDHATIHGLENTSSGSIEASCANWRDSGATANSKNAWAAGSCGRRRNSHTAKTNTAPTANR